MHELQQSFRRNIFRIEDDLSFISSNFPQERFDVYRQTIFENIINSLRITYPGVWKLLGDECANSAAYAYCQMDQNLPKTGCLDDFGGDFPEFLATLKQLSELPYLRDYAHYEWLKHVSYMAADPKPIAPSDLMSIPEDQIDNVTFQLRPSSHIFQSKYPLFDIHEVVQDGTAKIITLKQDWACGIISRKENEIHTYWIAEDNWFFIKKLFEGATLLESAQYAQMINNHFDLSSAIAFVLQAQLADKIINNGGHRA